MIEGLKLFDQYNRRARLYPALLVLFPTALMVACWFPNVITDVNGKSFILLFGSMGGLYLLASLSRVAGRKAEKRLLNKWGGWPTTILLRHRDSHLVAATKKRYHDFLKQNVPGIVFPTTEEEDENPAYADEIYVSAIEWLKEKRRGKDHYLVLEENIEYGFRRNMLGLKWIAVVLCFAAILISVGVAFPDEQSLDLKQLIDQLLLVPSSLSVAVVAALIVNLVALFFWSFYVTDEWVREAGDQYARALLATCE